MTKEGKFYKNQLALICMNEIKNQNFKKIEGYSSVHINFYAPNYRAHDIDNLNKIVLDAFQFAGVYENDKDVLRLYDEKYLPKKLSEGFFDAIICEMPKLEY